ncbi:MAG: hypothetical protein QM758_29160 [Armatimonas sp.]
MFNSPKRLVKGCFIAGGYALIGLCIFKFVSTYEMPGLFFTEGHNTLVTQSLERGAWMKVIRSGYGATTPDSIDIYITETPDNPPNESLVCSLDDSIEGRSVKASWDYGKIVIHIPKCKNLEQVRNRVLIRGKSVPVSIVQ